LSKEHEQVKLKSETAIEKLKNTEENEHQLANELNNKQTELINFALNIIQKNTFLEELRLKVNEIKAGTKDIESLIKLNELSNDINRHIALDKNRKTFQLQLEEANRDFYIRMNQKYPTLTEKEKRLAAYMRLNFSTKDIASILNITTKSVEINRYRLRKKLGIEQGINLYEFILSI
jgi:DNA-binding CsgD family transcriptional regulator